MDLSWFSPFVMQKSHRGFTFYLLFANFANPFAILLDYSSIIRVALTVITCKLFRSKNGRQFCDKIVYRALIGLYNFDSFENMIIQKSFAEKK